MGFLSKIFGRSSTVTVSRQDLAAAIAPLSGEKHAPHSNEGLAESLEDMAEWLRIGFDSEGQGDKGQSYDALRIALRMMAVQARNCDSDSANIDFNKQHVDAFCAHMYQCGQAAAYLSRDEESGERFQYQILPDRHGNELKVPLRQIYNRPGDDYGVRAEQLLESAANLRGLLETEPARAKSCEATASYIAAHPYLK
jgi:hypothetical protein